jgi:hypothetical protein
MNPCTHKAIRSAALEEAPRAIAAVREPEGTVQRGMVLVW